MLLHARISAADVSHALHHAVQLPNGNARAVEALLATELIEPPFAALWRGDSAALASHLDAAPHCLDATDAEGYTLLLRASENAQLELLALLLERGAAVEVRGPFGKSALSAAACNQVDLQRRLATLRLLLDHGADVNGRTGGGRTPLYSAATAGWHPIEPTRLLLESGADPHLVADSGISVLEEVSKQQGARARGVADLLRRYGAG
jgi:ankyrin repeat protein